MKNLIAYVKQHNDMCDIFSAYGTRMDPHNLTDANLVELQNKLDIDLSPENLACDGELQGIALRRKAKMLRKTQQELADLSMTRAVPVRQLRVA
jgi:hypothetical protein